MESPALSRRREAPRLISSWKKQFVIAYRRNSWLHWQQCNQLLRRCPNTKRANLRRHWVCVAKTPSTQEALTARKVRMWCCCVTISKKIKIFEYCGDCSCHLTGCNANISSSTVLDLQSEPHFFDHFRRRNYLWWLMMLLESSSWFPKLRGKFDLCTIQYDKCTIW